MYHLGYVNIFPLSGRGNKIELKLKPDNTFLAEWLSDGEYRIGGFLDLDQNGKYSFGSLFPFSFSEPVFMSPDTIKIRKRWEVAGVEMIYPGIN
jgi:hypothetical protein